MYKFILLIILYNNVIIIYETRLINATKTTFHDI